MQLTNPWSGRPEKLGRAILLILAVAAACAPWGGVLAELIGMVDKLIIMKDFEVTKEFMRSPDLKETDIIEYMI